MHRSVSVAALVARRARHGLPGHCPAPLVPLSLCASSSPSSLAARALGAQRAWCSAAAAAPAAEKKEEEKEEEKPEKTRAEKEKEELEKKEKQKAHRFELQRQHAKSSNEKFEDVSEFLDRHKDQLDKIKKAIEDGKEPSTSLLQYLGMFGGWCGRKVKNTAAWMSKSAETRAEEKAAAKEERAKNRAKSDEAMSVFYQTQEMVNLMKFKGVTFDQGKEEGVPAADFESFSRRVVDNYDVFKKTEAYSNMSFHVVKDPSKLESNLTGSPGGSSYREIDDGSLTDWMTEEHAAEEKQEAKVEEKPAPETAVARPPPFQVDYVTGEVTVLDTCSPAEFLDFLQREAPRAELRQQQLDEEQMKMFEALNKLIEAHGFNDIAFNLYGSKASLTDKEYKQLKEEGREKEYVMPGDVMEVIKHINTQPRFYKKYFKGQTLRIVPTAPARAYFIDEEAKEICLPKDFFKDTFLPVHKKYRRLQKVENFFRKLRFVAWILLITLLGDVQWPCVWPLVEA
eukprot:TRINITY_DN1595_c5_g1_i1.p1 TRINITY_DN1595_c5_g1~~TRINITY_DN1595_c5_g1_i1.p1  ORF type:complete len:511 (+),score=269.35 TRINITY_DN1595_c5_g1_i1:39-1571(+)